MSSIFLFSDKLKFLFSFFRFHFLKLARAFWIFFKKNKNLKKISIDYYNSWRFENSYLIIHLNFENAIWYRVGFTKGLNFNKTIIIDKRFISNKEITIEVFGLLEKQTYKIIIENDYRINSCSIIPEIKSFKNIWLNILQPETIIPGVNLNSNRPQLKIRNIEIENTHINFNHKPYKIQDFI